MIKLMQNLKNAECQVLSFKNDDKVVKPRK